MNITGKVHPESEKKSMLQNESYVFFPQSSGNVLFRKRDFKFMEGKYYGQ